MLLKTLLTATMIFLSGATYAGSIQVTPLGHGVSEISYQFQWTNCALPVGIERYAVTHPAIRELDQGLIDISIGNQEKLHHCHSPSPEINVSVKFLIETHRLGHDAEVLELRRASKYKLIINGKHMATVETGLLGDHEISVR